MSLIGIFDIDYYLIHLCKLKTIINLTRTNKYFYELIKNMSFYKHLMKINECKNKKLVIFKYGYLDVIKILCNSKKFKYERDHIDLAAEFGHINILKFVKKLGYKFICLGNKYIGGTIDRAGKRGQIHILDWFKNSDLQIKYTNYSINWASGSGHINILNWFKNSGLNFKYSKDAIRSASESGHIHVLDWFKNSNYKFKYGACAVDWASNNGHIHILEWFKNSEMEFKYSLNAINNASSEGHICVLEWFKNSTYEFRYDNNAIDNAARNGHTNILN